MGRLKGRVLVILVLALMVCSAQAGQAALMGTAWTYQGRLIDNNDVADGVYDFQFKLYDAPDPNCVQVGGDINTAGVDVIDGYFTVELDFPDFNDPCVPCVFDGSARWLEIGVRPEDPNDQSGYSVLSPRQEITPTPYALYAASGPGVPVPLDLSGSSSDAIIKGTNTGNGQGMYGVHDSSGNYGYLGSIGHGVYGMDDSSGNFGHLGSDSYGAYGNDDGSGNHGYLGSDTYGAYGKHDSSQNYGYLGSNAYGVYGMDDSSGNYGYIGSNDYGVYGKDDGSGNCGYLGSDDYGVHGESSSGYAGHFKGDAAVTGDLTVGGTFSASGIDADTLDTLDSTAFSLDGHDHDPCYVNVTGDTMSGYLTVTTNYDYAIKGENSRLNAYGLYGEATGIGGRGVFGSATDTGNNMNYGGFFSAAAETGIGVYGEATYDSNFTTNFGGYFVASGDYGRGVYGQSDSSSGYGGYFEGRGYFSSDVGIGISIPTGRLQVVGDEVRIGNAGTVNYATADGDLYVEDDLEVDDNLYVGNDLDVGNALDVGDDVDVGGGLDVTGDLVRIWDGGADVWVSGVGDLYVENNLEVDGSHVIFGGLTGTSSGNYVRVLNGGLYYDSSSAKYKDDIQSLTDDFTKILDASPKSFIDKVSGQSEIGFIAEEFDNLGLNNLVVYKDGKPDALKYNLVSLYLLEVVKDQVKLTEQLKAENEQLNQRLDGLERTMQELRSAKEVQL